MGQDPYHNVNQAHGLAFSVRPPTGAPPSLRNMYTALKSDYPSFVPPAKNGGHLTPWAERGVLMLNACLTVRAHEPNSHADRGWEKFTQKVIDLVSTKRTKGVVFMVWGAPASKRVTKVDQNRHLVLKTTHPSPFSAHKGFLNCGHFKMANKWLVTRYGAGSEVDWSLGGPPAPEPSGQPLEKVRAKNTTQTNREEEGEDRDPDETEEEYNQEPVKKDSHGKATGNGANGASKDDFSETEDDEAVLLEAAEAAEGEAK